MRESAAPAPGAWRLAAGCVAGVAVVCLLVVWRSLHTEGAWLVAMRLSGVLSVLGLLLAIWLALRPVAGPRELLLRVTEGDDGPTT